MLVVLFLGCYNSYLVYSTCQTLSVNKMNNESAAEEGKRRGINRRETKTELSIGIYGINNLINYITLSVRDINA